MERCPNDWRFKKALFLRLQTTIINDRIRYLHLILHFDTQKEIAMKKDKPPRKPRKTFPLFAHRNGSWCKTINGKHEPFGGWRNDRLGVEALKKYNLYLSRLESGVPEQISMIVTVDDCLETWMESRDKSCDSGEISYSVYRSSQRIAKRLSKLLVGSKRFDSVNETNWSDCHGAFKRSEDGKELTAKSFTSTIKQIRVWLNWCRTNDLISGRVIKIFKTWLVLVAFNWGISPSVLGIFPQFYQLLNVNRA